MLSVERALRSSSQVLLYAMLTAYGPYEHGE